MQLRTQGRHFYLDGEPFFWLGDTAWLLFSRLSREEASVYLHNRAEKGFNVIQATLVHHGGFATSDGKKALIDDDFSRPAREGYWEHVLSIVREAASLNMFMALLPSWGSFAKNGQLNTENAAGYARFLAETFGGEENVIWLLGGDVRGDAAKDVFELMGNEFKRLCPERIVGYHPFGRCDSSMWFKDSPWLDFNMFQSGHRDYTQQFLGAWDDNDVFYGEDNYKYVLNDLKNCPNKPTLDGEPGYELIPHGLHDPTQPRWLAHDVRRYAWWSVLSGAAGHTYGDNSIMQFYKPGFKGSYGPLNTWGEALNDPGSGQMRHLKELMLEYGFDSGEEASRYVAANGERHFHKVALLTSKGFIAYSPEGESIRVNVAALPFKAPVCTLLDPVSGAKGYVGRLEKTADTLIPFPDRRDGTQDWAVMIGEADA